MVSCSVESESEVCDWVWGGPPGSTWVHLSPPGSTWVLRSRRPAWRCCLWGRTSRPSSGTRPRASQRSWSSPPERCSPWSRRGSPPCRSTESTQITGQFILDHPASVSVLKPESSNPSSQQKPSFSPFRDIWLDFCPEQEMMKHPGQFDSVCS